MPAFFASTDIFRPQAAWKERRRFVDFKVTPPNGAFPLSLISVGGVTSLLELELRRPVGASRRRYCRSGTRNSAAIARTHTTLAKGEADANQLSAK